MWSQTKTYIKTDRNKISIASVCLHFPHHFERSPVEESTWQIITYTKTAKRAVKMKENLDAFLDRKDTLHGGTMLIYGNLFADEIFVQVENPQENID